MQTVLSARRPRQSRRYLCVYVRRIEGDERSSVQCHVMCNCIYAAHAPTPAQDSADFIEPFINQCLSPASERGCHSWNRATRGHDSNRLGRHRSRVRRTPRLRHDSGTTPCNSNTYSRANRSQTRTARLHHHSCRLCATAASSKNMCDAVASADELAKESPRNP